MKDKNSLKSILLFIGDIVALYAALLIALFLRYGADYYNQFVNVHAGPFTVIFILWILVFYIAGLYDLRRLRNSIDFLKTLSLALVVNAFIAIFLFYIIPAFGIAPKTNLLIFLVIFAIIEIIWRRMFNRGAESGEAPNKVLLIGTGELANEVAVAVESNPQLGYAIRAHIDEETAEREPESVAKLATELEANLIVVTNHLKRHGKFGKTLYQLFGKGITVADLTNFYEQIMGKIPLADLEETWFIENIENAAKFYDPLKRAFEIISAIVIGVILLPFEIIIAIVIKLTSRGPVIYKQKRVGQYEREFTFYKFRTMRIDAEKNGAQWAATTNDPRSTVFGKFLRASHLDELPQLVNILKGDISFVGPRPERPEFVSKLKEQVPYYEARLLVKPGVTGWAALNYHNDQTIEDVKQKVQYDIYYLKNRSAILDIAIVLKTIKSLFVNPR